MQYAHRDTLTTGMSSTPPLSHDSLTPSPLNPPQVLSDGMMGFQQACKLEDTPLPFPYAQMVSLVLMIFAVSYPLLAASKAAGSDTTFAPWLGAS